MAAAPQRNADPATEAAHQSTLLDLIQAVVEVTSSDAEACAAVLSLLRSGRVRLIGNFRGSLLSG